MNHNYQKYHEEDTIAEIIDVMEAMGWNFKFQYDNIVFRFYIYFIDIYYI